MVIKLKRYWFEFEYENLESAPPGARLGCGVTAFTYDDALHIMDKKLFIETRRPPIKKVIKDIDVRTLDPGHVLPNYGVPSKRGIWYPPGYDYD
jgi:hypothetical protein